MLQDVAARRLRHDDVGAPANLGGERPHVPFGHPTEAGDVAAVEQRGTATARPAQGAFDVVALVDLDQVLPDPRLLVLDGARGEHRHSALRLDDRRPSGGARTTWRTVARANGGSTRTADTPVTAWTHPADERAGLGTDDSVGDGRNAGGESADPIGTTEQPRRRPGPCRLDAGVELHRIGPQHQPREVDVALVERRCAQCRREGAVDGTAPAVEAFVDHLILIGRRHAPGVAVLVAIDHLEQRRKCCAQRDALLTPVTDLEDAAEFGTHLRLVEVRRILGVVDARHVGWTRRHRIAARPRPPCDAVRHAERRAVIEASNSGRREHRQHVERGPKRSGDAPSSARPCSPSSASTRSTVTTRSTCS